MCPVPGGPSAQAHSLKLGARVHCRKATHTFALIERMTATEASPPVWCRGREADRQPVRNLASGEPNVLSTTTPTRPPPPPPALFVPARIRQVFFSFPLYYPGGLVCLYCFDSAMISDVLAWRGVGGLSVPFRRDPPASARRDICIRGHVFVHRPPDVKRVVVY